MSAPPRRVEGPDGPRRPCAWRWPRAHVAVAMAAVLVAAAGHAEPVDLESSTATLQAPPEEDPDDAQARAAERWALEWQRRQHLDAQLQRDETELAGRAAAQPDEDWLQDAVARRAAEEQWARQRSEVANARQALNRFLDEEVLPATGATGPNRTERGDARARSDELSPPSPAPGGVLRTVFLAMVLATGLSFALFLLLRPPRQRHHRSRHTGRHATSSRDGHDGQRYSRRRRRAHGDRDGTVSTSPASLPALEDAEPPRSRHRHRHRRRRSGSSSMSRNPATPKA